MKSRIYRAPLFRFSGMLTRTAAAIGLILLLSSCGGGGGGDSFLGAGRVSLEVTPNKIDVGDRTLVRVRVEDANEDGVILIVSFPQALFYVLNTAFLEVDGTTFDIGPDVNAPGANDANYLVFFISKNELDENGDGTVEFQLEGASRIQDREIAVDLDVNDALIPDGSEFDPNAPEFQAEQSRDIEVEA